MRELYVFVDTVDSDPTLTRVYWNLEARPSCDSVKRHQNSDIKKWGRKNGEHISPSSGYMWKITDETKIAYFLLRWT